ncbi:MAG: S8 family serine peptidase [Caldilineaceae bacterium]|nr:S8 family serine peptidase [Caldilineaceae bacterium]
MKLNYGKWLIVRFVLILVVVCQPVWALKAAIAKTFPIAQSSPQTIVQLAPMSAILQKELAQADGPVSFLVILKEQADAQTLVASAEVSAASRQTRAALLYHQLARQAQNSQADLRTWLAEQGVAYRSFYIINMVEVTGDASLAASLRQRPEVARLAANPHMPQQLIVEEATAAAVPSTAPKPAMRTVELTGTTPMPASVPYGLTNTGAPDVWALGYEGQGIVVASQDTGVEWDHPALKTHYRGWNESDATVSHVYNWFDAWDVAGRPSFCSADAQVPCDDNGHGTHTVGTMLGDDPNDAEILGMAPKAKWIGCRNMKNGVGTPASYIACFEFMLAPYPQGGDPATDGHPELAPHVINNSWSCPPSEGCDADSLQQIVETMRAAGIMVVASAGNEGSPSASGCQTVVDPIAIYDATFSIGAHDVNGNIASFSSRGPVTIDESNRAKPDMTAPGVDVYSAWLMNSVFAGYRTASGTSMASPHMAGAVALLWSAQARLIGQIDQTEQILLKSATPVPFNQCGEAANSVPNMTYGYGRLNILAAVEMAENPTALTVHIQGLDTKGLANAQVSIVDQQTGYRYAAVSNGAGDATFAALYPGNYTVHVNAAEAAFANADLQITSGGTQELTVMGGWPLYMPIIVRN